MALFEYTFSLPDLGRRPQRGQHHAVNKVRGRVWERKRCRLTPITKVEQYRARVKYIMAQATAAGLVARPNQKVTSDIRQGHLRYPAGSGAPLAVRLSSTSASRMRNRAGPSTRPGAPSPRPGTGTPT